MIAFIVRRFLTAFLVLICVTAFTFVLVQMAPGGPFERERKLPASAEAALKKRFNLDGTLLENLGRYMGGVMMGDLGPSIKYRERPVARLLADGLPVSAMLGAAAFLIATVGGVTLGTVAAIRQNSWVDTSSMLSALALISLPTFVTGPLAVLIFGMKLQVLPVGGWSSWTCIILPSIVLAGPYVAYVARLTRSSMLEVLTQDFIRTARAKGLDDMTVAYRHAMKVAMLPVVSYTGPLAAFLLTGSIVVETIFQIPGAGSYFVTSLLGNDHLLLCGVTIVYCALLLGLNLIVDIAYAWLDPRIKLYD